MFKRRPDKLKHHESIRTVTGTHNEFVNMFEKRKHDLPKKKTKLAKLQAQLDGLESDYNSGNVAKWATVRSSIDKLEDEIYDIENCISESEYYCKVSDIITDYYDTFDSKQVDEYVENLEDIETLSDVKKSKKPKAELSELGRLSMISNSKKKVKKPTKKRHKKKTKNSEDIMSFFNQDSDKDMSEDVKPTNTKENKLKRADLLDLLLTAVDSNYVSKKSTYNPIKNCPSCGIEQTLIPSEGLFTCIGCGEAEMVIVESDRPNFKDPVPEKSGYPYKRIGLVLNRWQRTREGPRGIYSLPPYCELTQFCVSI